MKSIKRKKYSIFYILITLNFVIFMNEKEKKLGESEIRTHGTFSSSDFKSDAIDHSAISPIIMEE